MPGFHQIVAESWAAPVQAGNKARALHIKLLRLAKTLKRWNRNRIEDMKDTLAAQETILRLDQLQEARQLTSAELQQRRSAKDRVLGLAVVRKFKLRQWSHLTWIRIGDANSKLFHLWANACHRKNHIATLQYMGTEHTGEEEKATALHDHFSNHLGFPTCRQNTLNWETLRLQTHDLRDLDNDITESEIERAISEMPSEKAPGLDGYIGGFFKRCWHIVKLDVIEALQEIFALRPGCWNLLNSANIALIPKNEEAQGIGEYRPISIILCEYRPISIMHNMARLLGKVLANILTSVGS
jgi:hypothetical protein